ARVVRKVGFILPVMKSCILAALVLALGVSAFVVSAQPQPRGGLTIDQLIDIQHPSNAMWTPDGRHVVFVWDRAGVSKVYVVDLTAEGQAATPRELTAAGAQLGGAFWSSDGRALLLPKNGDLWRVPIDGSTAAPVWTTPAAESNIVPSPDGARVAFVRSAARSGAAAAPAGRGGRGRGGAGGGDL